MKYIDEYRNGVNPRPEEYNFNKNAQKIDNPLEKSYAKIIEKNERISYYIRVHQSVPLDPMGTYGKRDKFIETKMKPASKSTFDFYMMYLKTKNSIYMTKARRGFTND